MFPFKFFVLLSPYLDGIVSGEGRDPAYVDRVSMGEPECVALRGRERRLALSHTHTSFCIFIGKGNGEGKEGKGLVLKGPFSACPVQRWCTPYVYLSLSFLHRHKHESFPLSAAPREKGGGPRCLIKCPSLCPSLPLLLATSRGRREKAIFHLRRYYYYRAFA